MDVTPALHCSLPVKGSAFYLRIWYVIKGKLHREPKRNHTYGNLRAQGREGSLLACVRCRLWREAQQLIAVPQRLGC